MDHFNRFFPDGFGRKLQVKLLGDRDDKDEEIFAASARDKRFEYAVRCPSNQSGDCHAVHGGFTVRIFVCGITDLLLIQQPHHIRFLFCHMKTFHHYKMLIRFILPYNLLSFNRKRQNKIGG